VSAAKRTKKPDPGTICREWCARMEKGDLPKALLLMAPTRGEEEVWFGERILASCRSWARSQEDLDLLELDGGSPDFSADVLFDFIGSQGLFGGRRLLVFGRAEKALAKSSGLQAALETACLANDDLRMLVQASGTTKAAKALAGIKGDGIYLERFRRLYGDPPPWRPHDLDASEAAQFVQAEGRAMNLRLASGSSGALVECVGNRPADLVKSLEHFSLLEEETVTADRVREVVTHSAEGDAFRFADAVIQGDGRGAFRCLRQLEHRGLRTWDGKRLAPREAIALLWSVLGRQLDQTRAVLDGLARGMNQKDAFQMAGVPVGGPPAKRMESRLRLCDKEQLERVQDALLQSERRIKQGKWRQPLHVLEWLALRGHRRKESA